MPIQYTNTELELINIASRVIASELSAIAPNAPNSEWTLAGVRYYLGTNTERGNLTPQAEDQYRIILCKMVYNAKENGESPEQFIITYNRTGLMAHPMFKQLAVRYRSHLSSQGFGMWLKTQHERIMGAVFANWVGSSTTYPAIIHRPTLENMIQIYHQQALDVDNATDTVSVKSQLTDSIFQDMSMSDRREMSGNNKRQCYQCHAPKLPKIQCGVCGYKPRSL